MAKNQNARNVHPDSSVHPRHMVGGAWKRKKIEKKKGSQTPGSSKRSDTCQLTAISGTPRKAFTRSRGCKLPYYDEYCAFFDRVNK